MAYERIERYVSGLSLKLAGAETAAPMTFSGYGAYFGNTDSYGDVIAKGAFAQSLREIKKSKAWPPMLLQHGGWGMTADDMMPIGIWTEMVEDENGLYVEGKLADTERGREAYGLLKMEPRPAISGMSIGYRPKEVAIGTKPGEPARTLKKIELIEISLVTFPANDQARIDQVKGMPANIKTIRDFEGFLRDAGGFSNRAARAIARDGFKGLDDARDEPDSALSELAAAVRRATQILQP